MNVMHRGHIYFGFDNLTLPVLPFIGKFVSVYYYSLKHTWMFESLTCSKDPIHPLFQQSTENNVEGNTTPYKRAKGYIANHPLIVIRRSAFHCHWLAD